LSKLKELQNQRKKWMEWKNIKPLQEAIKKLPNIKAKVKFEDIIKIEFNATDEDMKLIYDAAWLLRPWRKGPFKLNQLFIDTEWQSFIKYNMLKPYFDVEDKVVGDIGCNNGYYMFRMLDDKPKKVIGFDPSALYKSQFDFINHFAKTDIIYELLGVEHLDIYDTKFDLIFCLGVLYHRADPVGMLKSLKKGLNPKGEVILDTFMIDGDDEIILSPAKTYSKIPNIYFIPTSNALRNWCTRAGFGYFEVLTTSITTLDEQRKTDWINTQSLNDFLDPDDPLKTVEGYPAPKRVYVKLKI